MATFVLVHGSLAGSVVWRELAPKLRKAGHEVYAPTLTGIGARRHLLTRPGSISPSRADSAGAEDRPVWGNTRLSAAPGTRSARRRSRPPRRPALCGDASRSAWVSR
jgi:alpha-beta hydrolase superfamily lysophospholipase